MAGFDTIPQAAEEAGAKVPSRNLGIAVLISIFCGALFYVLIIFVVAVSMPWTESARLPMTTSAVFETAFGFLQAAKLVLVTALLGLISTLNGVYIAASRLLVSMRRGGMIADWFARVHPTHHTPQNALLFVGIVSLLGPFIGKSALVPIVNTSSFAFTCALTVTCLSTVRLRTSAPAFARAYRSATIFVYLGIAISFLLVLLMVLPQSPGRLGRLESLVVLVWAAAGVIAFLWRRHMHPISEPESDRLILGEYR